MLEFSSKFSNTIVLLRRLRHFYCNTIVLLRHSRNCFNEGLPGPGEHDTGVEDAQPLEHVNEPVPVPLSTVGGPKLQLTTDVSISTVYTAVHCKKNQIVYVYENTHSGKYVNIVCVYLFVCMYVHDYVFLV